MFSYVAFLYGTAQILGNEDFNEGQALAQQCVSQLEALKDKEQFPPRLLILFTPPDYRSPERAKELLEGIGNTFEKAQYGTVPLIGGSAAAVFFHRRVHKEGALLICLASRILKADVAAANNVVSDAGSQAARAIDGMLHKLNLYAKGQDVNPFDNQLLFALFPGFREEKYEAPKLYAMMQDKLRARAPIFGGVTSTNDSEHIEPGLQYADREVYQEAVVVAGITSGTPLGLSFAHGLTGTDSLLQVSELGSNPRTIKRFHQGAALEVIGEQENENGVILLENISVSHHSWMGRPERRDDSIQMLRKIEKGAAFRVWRPDPAKMHKNIATEVENSLKRIRLENPTACLGIRCAGYPWIAESIGLDLENELAEIEKLTGTYVGAFMAGEAGTDSFGRSYLSNWHTSTMAFGDELRDATAYYRGFEELAKFSREAAAGNPRKTHERLLKLIYDIGYPGAMISSVLHDEQAKMIVGQAASGSRFAKIVNTMREEWDGNSLLATVARKRKPEFILSTPEEAGADPKSTDPFRGHSQYIIPLVTLRREVIGVLQIDLGQVRYRKLHPTERAVLDALGNVVNSRINRGFNWEENKIALRLDQALKKCLSCRNVNEGLKQFLSQALRAFRLKMGHIRLSELNSSRLRFEAGVGAYAELAYRYRPETDETDLSPSRRAFLRKDEPIVTNDASNDPHHMRMCEPSVDPCWSNVMTQLRSFINMGFESGSGERGTISLVSHSPWFFNWYHERACIALGKRVGFLIEHLRRRENEMATRKSRRMVRAKVALVAQSAHRFSSLLGQLVSMQEQIRNSATGAERDRKMVELSERITAARDEIQHHMSLAEGAMRLDMQPRDFGRFIQRVISRAGRTDDAAGVEFQVSVPPGLKVEMDGKLMEAAFVNFINNSIRAMKGITSRSRTLTISAQVTEEQTVEVNFIDTGDGMNRSEVDAQKRRIEPQSDIRQRAKATGWGLQISSVLLEAHGARIKDLTSKKNKGTTVTVILPLDQP